MTTIIELKQQNHSLCDQRKNINLKSLLIGREINIRVPVVESYLELDDFYKCKYASIYSKMTTEDLYIQYSILLSDYINITNQIDRNGRAILKLRGSSWKF